MGALMAELPRVRRGPLESLYAALRRRAPQIAATRPGGDGDGEGVRVAYRGQTAAVLWDDDINAYVWRAGGQIGSDAEKTAELIAWTLSTPAGSA
ncbi:hypothetical protein ACN3XK_63360 [Actinomadura welshii]